MTTIAVTGQLGQWWDALTVAKQIFYGIGIVAGIVSLILAVLGFIGLEHHEALDVGVPDVDHGGGGIFSIKPLTGFFLGFGWGGAMALEQGMSVPVATIIASVSGAAIMAVIVRMFRAIYSLRSDGTMRITDAVNAIGTVYVSLPPNRAAGGQVTVEVSGRRETLAALNQATHAIPSGEKVKVVSVIDGRTVLVEPL